MPAIGEQGIEINGLRLKRWGLWYYGYIGGGEWQKKKVPFARKPTISTIHSMLKLLFLNNKSDLWWVEKYVWCGGQQTITH